MEETIMNIGTAILHINESLDEPARRDLESRVAHIDCVIDQPAFGARTPHLMIVSYDADCTRASAVLDAVCCQGLHGQVVGGI
jgi:hypothetical protein